MGSSSYKKGEGIKIPKVKKKHILSDLRYEKLLTIGSMLPSDSHDLGDLTTEIPWLNPTLIQEGKEFVKRNWFAIFFAHLISLLLGVALRPGISVMMRTGLSHKKEHSLKRYLSTTLHVRTWYEADNTEVIRDMRKVRRLHAKAVKNFYNVPLPLNDIQLTDREKLLLEAVKEDIQEIRGPGQAQPPHLNTYEPELPISQLGLVMTQFTFLGFIVLFPKAFGIHDPRGLEGFIHLWALLGKYVGIEDEFNLGLQPDMRLLRRLYTEISVPGLKECDDATLVFWDAITYGVQQYRPFVTMNSLILFLMKDVMGIEKGQKFIDLMSWYDLLCYNILHFLCAHILQWSVFRWITNINAGRAITSAKKKFM